MGSASSRQQRPSPLIGPVAVLRGLAHLLLAAALLFLAGLVLFAHIIEDEQNSDIARADGIVVLTGGQERIAEGLRLLAHGKGERMLISGVNGSTSRRQLSALYPKAASLFQCCIDLGWKARNTTGNAVEAREWLSRRGYTSLVVVTSSPHMPRSLLEMRRIMPEVALIPYSVSVPHLRIREWWFRRQSLKLVLTEYLKFLPSLGRCFADRMGVDDGSSGVMGVCLNFAIKF